MLNLASRGAAVMLAGSAIALTAATLPAAATTTGWRPVTKIHLKGFGAVLTGVDAVRANDAWAAGSAENSKGKDDTGLIEHWNGKSWSGVKLPAKVAKAWNKLDPAVIAVGASSTTSVWAVSEFPGAAATAGDGYVRLSGKTWTAGTLPDSRSATDLVLATSVADLGKADTWVFGGSIKLTTTTPAFVPYAARYNGKRWTTFKVPAAGQITAFSAISPDNIWAVTGTSGLAGELVSGFGASVSPASAVLHWNGKSWQKVSAQPSLPAGGDLTSISAGKQVLVGGDVATSTGATTEQFTDMMTGSTWGASVKLRSSNAKASSDHLPYQIESLVPAGGGSYWALSDNLSLATPKLWRYAGGKWSAPISPMFGNKRRALVQLADVPGTSSVWGAGEIGPASSAQGLIALSGPTPR